MKFILLLFLTGCGLATGSGPARNVPEFEARLERLRRDLQIPGMSAAIATGQRIAWARGFGYADVENSIPAADTTSYHLASLTKTFASTIVMQLVETGQLNLETPVADFGIVLPGSGVVRVKHLLTHTSEGDPGSTYAYNGDRFGLLDQVILRSSGESFGQRLACLVLGPLHLAHTAPNILNPTAFSLAGLDQGTFERNLAQGYSSDGRTRLPYPRYRHCGWAHRLGDGRRPLFHRDRSQRLPPPRDTNAGLHQYGLHSGRHAAVRHRLVRPTGPGRPPPVALWVLDRQFVIDHSSARPRTGVRPAGQYGRPEPHHRPGRGGPLEFAGRPGVSGRIRLWPGYCPRTVRSAVTGSELPGPVR